MDFVLAQNLSYYVAMSPTPGTPAAFAVNAVVSETAGYFLMMKNNAQSGGQRLHLDYLRLICGVVPASATAAEFFLKSDTVSRYTSGGTQLNPVNVSADMPNASQALVFTGNLTTPAAGSAARVLARGKLRTGIPVVGDEFIIKFGTTEAAHAGGLGGTVAQRIPVHAPPVVIGPQQWLGLQLWFPGNVTTAPQFEVEAGWWETPHNWAAP